MAIEVLEAGTSGTPPFREQVLAAAEVNGHFFSPAELRLSEALHQVSIRQLTTTADGNAAGGFVGSTDAIDGSGVAPTRIPSDFLLTSGTGEHWHYRVPDEQKKARSGGAPANTRWDNHLARV
jgi:hypothetical protein